MTTVEPPHLLHVSPTGVELRGRALLYFGGSDYFRFTWHPRIREAVARTARTLGHNLAASRMTTGNHPLYAELERTLARVLGFPTAVLTPTGYTAPLVVGQALAGRITHALVDERAHASLKDGARLSRAMVRVFRHDDVASLRQQLRRCGAKARVAVFTDGVSAHEGTISPLKEYLAALPDDGILVVDDAHGLGIVGARGGGALELAGIADLRVLLTVTLSKALGCYGGAVVGPRWFREAVLDRSGLYAGGSPLGLPYVKAAGVALALLNRRGPVLRRRLRANVRRVKAMVPSPDADWLTRPGPMFAIAPSSLAAQESLRRRLLRSGIYPPLIRYAGGPADRFFRFAISTAHSGDHLDRLGEVLAMSVDALDRDRARECH